MPEAGGIVLAGGRSSRMGADKANLEWHGSTLLRRVCGLIARAVDGPVVVVAAPGQALPDAGPGVEVVRDAEEDMGPLGGLAQGLSALDGRVAVAYASATDCPFLHPAFVARVTRSLDDHHDVALPVARGFPQPLAAAYRVALAPLVAELVEDGRLRPASLLSACRVDRLDEAVLLADAALAAADPDLGSLENLNEPAEYRAARERPAPAVTVEGFGLVRAATLGAAAREAGVRLAGTRVVLGGRRRAADPELPLVEGDAVAFER